MNDATKIVREDAMMDLESVFNEIKAMSQEQFDDLMDKVRAMSEPPYDETVNEEPVVAPMNQLISASIAGTGS